MKGIRVVNADYDAFERDSVGNLTQGRPLLEVANSKEKEDQALMRRIDTQRERSARNIVKDDALAHLPPKDTPEQVGRRPKQILLFGRGHKEGLEQAFDNLGLHVKVFAMEKTTDMRAKATEQLSHTLRKMLPTLIELTLSEAEQTPPKGPSYK